MVSGGSCLGILFVTGLKRQPEEVRLEGMGKLGKLRESWSLISLVKLERVPFLDISSGECLVSWQRSV